jgi:NAD(P)-dependent dehydrogenase (short-subunit alcohol dehydrogenase family)
VGLAICRPYLDSGLRHLVAVDRDPVPEELAARGPGLVTVVRGDVGDEAPHAAAAAAAMAATGRVDILVNNAGIALVKPIHAHAPEEWDRLMATNVKALYWAARHVVPIMAGHGGGVILNTGSISGQVGIPGQGAYAATKGAVHQITRQMAVEYAPQGIRVNAVALGTVDTPIVAQSARESGDPAAFWHMLTSNHPLGRVARPEEAAWFFAFLASDRAAFFTGAVLALDGGFTAR